jgi:hypothetical protein
MIALRSRLNLSRAILWLVGLAILPLAVPAVAAESAGVNLILPHSLAGWDQGEPVHGWRAREAALTGSPGASTLLSGWTFGDFSLDLHWKVAPGAKLLLSLPEVPTGEGIQLRLAESGKDSTLSAPGQAAQTAVTASLPAGAMHTAHIERTGDDFSASIDDQPLGKLHVDAAKRYGLQLAVDGGEVEVADVTVRQPEGEPIFNGHDLTGWWSPPGLQSWQGKDGVIECLHKDGNYLRTEKSYGNFTLSLEYKASPHCNSGIGIRTAREGWPSGDGFELQILDAPGLINDSTMAIYRNVEPLARADHAEEWNRVVIQADGPMISAWVNGQLVQQANTARHPELRHRHAEGWIGMQDHGGKIEFRNLRVLSAPPGNGLAAWYAPRPATGPELVCDRLLNPERLSAADGITAGAVTTAVSGSEEKVLADLTGPGAVTQIWHSRPGGKLAFYFDSESKPAIECRPDQLSGRLPNLFVEQKEPVLTCLPYARHLKIVLRQGEPADYRVEYVTFPADVPVETFQARHPILPPGWLAAIDYRGHQYGWGTHREADVELRASDEAKHLEPGQSVTLVSRPGKGIVQWLKLQSDSAVLDSDELWLEISIDGEAEPAIAAPARYFFPSLIGCGTTIDGKSPGPNHGNHYNFLAVYRAGFTSMLAMPFADGVTVRARNAGQSPLDNVAATLSVIEDDAGTFEKKSLQIDKRLRLRGRFQRAGDSPQWLEWKGSGRWVGLVTQTPDSGSPRLASVTVDGRQLPGWAGVSLDALLGVTGDEKDFFRLESGRAHGIAWRYWQLAPLTFEQSIVVTPSGPAADCLTLVYVR